MQITIEQLATHKKKIERKCPIRSRVHKNEQIFTYTYTAHFFARYIACV